MAAIHTTRHSTGHTRSLRSAAVIGATLLSMLLGFCSFAQAQAVNAGYAECHTAPSSSANVDVLYPDVGNFALGQDLIVVVTTIAATNTPQVSMTSSATAFEHSAVGNVRQYLYRVRIGGITDRVNVQISGGPGAGFVYCIAYVSLRDLKRVSPLDRTGTANANSATFQVSLSQATRFVPEILVGSFGRRGLAGGSSVAPYLTNAFACSNDNTLCVDIGSKIAVTTGTHPRQFNSNAALAYTAVLVSYEAPDTLFGNSFE